MLQKSLSSSARPLVLASKHLVPSVNSSIFKGEHKRFAGSKSGKADVSHVPEPFQPYAEKFYKRGEEVEAQNNFSSTDHYFESDRNDLTGGDTTGRFKHYAIMTGPRVLWASGIRLTIMKLIGGLSASADVLALASAEVDIGNIPVGQTVTVKWRGKPVFIRHRTQGEIDSAKKDDGTDLRHPETDAQRNPTPEWAIMIGVCTHLGCVPLTGEGEWGGWFCPCHGSHYDTSGRIRKGPAPLNLEIPTYKFLTDTKLLIG